MYLILKHFLINIVTIHDFEFLYIIGRGGFGRIWKVKSKDTGKYFALKQMDKSKIIEQNSEKSILKERLFLSKLRNPFIVSMICSFTDKDNIYLVLKLLTGGDLRYHLCNYNYSFTETQLKFLLSNILLALKYIHAKGIIHRDLKPENILFDDKGYAYLCDFGIAWSVEEKHEGDNSGTPGYMAPETLFEKEQKYSVDFYSLGAIGYEIIIGKAPYEGNNRHDIQKQMEEKKASISSKDAKHFTKFCIDCINSLLNQNGEKRLGAKNGVSEIQDHTFFKGLNWDLIYQHKYLSPLTEIIKALRDSESNHEELFDSEYCQKKDNVNKSTLEKYEKIKKGKNYGNYFRKYSYICLDNLVKEISVNTNNKGNNNLINGSKNLIKNQSVIYPNIYNVNKRKNYNNYNGKEKLQFPILKQKIRESMFLRKQKENKLKGYYENRLLKYKSAIKNLLYNNRLPQNLNLQDYSNNNNNLLFNQYQNNFNNLYNRCCCCNCAYNSQWNCNCCNNNNNNKYNSDLKTIYMDNDEDIDQTIILPANRYFYDQNLIERKNIMNIPVFRNTNRYITMAREPYVEIAETSIDENSDDVVVPIQIPADRLQQNDQIMRNQIKNGNESPTKFKIKMVKVSKNRDKHKPKEKSPYK